MNEKTIAAIPGVCPDCANPGGIHAWCCSVLVRLCAQLLADDDPSGWRGRATRLAAARPGSEGSHWGMVAGAPDPEWGPAGELRPVEGGLAEVEESWHNLPGARGLLAEVRVAWADSELMQGAVVLPFLFEPEGRDERSAGEAPERMV